jgi:hypothetical protein
MLPIKMRIEGIITETRTLSLSKKATSAISPNFGLSFSVQKNKTIGTVVLGELIATIMPF